MFFNVLIFRQHNLKVMLYTPRPPGGVIYNEQAITGK